MIVGFPGKCFPLIALWWGVVAFGVAWIYAGLISFAGTYLHTPLAYVAAFGVIWVLASVYWGLGQIPRHLDDLGRCFVEQYYAAFADRWKRRFFSNKGMILCAIALWLFGAIMGLVGMFPLHRQDTLRPANHVLPQAWYQGDVLSHYLLFLIISGFACFVGGSGLWLFLVNLPFLDSLSKFRVVPLPSVVLRKFRPMSDFYVVSTGAWFVGVGLVAIVVFRNLSPIAAIFLAVTSLIGVTAFVLPQIVFHNLIISAHVAIANMRIDEFNNDSGTPPKRVSELTSIDAIPVSQGVWVFDNSDVVGLLVSNFLPPLILILKSKVGLYH